MKRPSFLLRLTTGESREFLHLKHQFEIMFHHLSCRNVLHRQYRTNELCPLDLDPKLKISNHLIPATFRCCVHMPLSCVEKCSSLTNFVFVSRPSRLVDQGRPLFNYKTVPKNRILKKLIVSFNDGVSEYQ